MNIKIKKMFYLNNFQKTRLAQNISMNNQIPIYKISMELMVHIKK